MRSKSTNYYLPIFHSNLLYKTGHYFLDRQYSMILKIILKLNVFLFNFHSPNLRKN